MLTIESIDAERAALMRKAMVHLYQPELMVGTMIEFTTLVHQYLVAEGWDCAYEPTMLHLNRPTHYNVIQTIYVNVSKYTRVFSADDTAVHLLRITRFHIYIGGLILTSVEELLKYLHQVRDRHRARDYCSSCYYNSLAHSELWEHPHQRMFCGLGMDITENCTHHKPYVTISSTSSTIPT